MTKVNGNEKPNIKIIKHYIKDLSFENPQNINENNSENNNNIVQNMSFIQTSFKNNFFSLIMKYSCECSSKQTGNKLLVLELDYFGFFKILNNKTSNQADLAKEAAKLMLPFVKSIIKYVTNKGGNIIISIENVDFELIKN